MHRTQEKFKIKRKIRIKSLEASICNVALFKSMKDKDFRDTIFISYCEEGVILQAISEAEWKKAHQHIEKFLQNKKIELLIDGFDKDVYESLINKGLKQITRKIRQSDEQCPYINIIHYQKLRKSCEYMDKERYVEPLKDWQKKNKKNPNFAFLIVQPISKFDEIKKQLLEHLLNQPITMKTVILEPINFMYILFFSSNKDIIRSNCNRRQIQISAQKEQSDKAVIKAINYTNIDLEEYTFAIVESQSKITKSGVSLEVISASQMKQQIKNAKLYCKDNPGDIVQKKFEQLQQEYGQNFILVPYRKQQQAKYKTIISKFTNNKFSKEELQKKIESHKIYSEEQVQYMDELYTTKNYKCLKVCINNSPFIIHQYKANGIDIDTFAIYLDQLQSYYCSYLIRYYGLIVRKPTPRESIICNQPVSYLLVFDFHQNNLIDLLQNDMILDNMQIASIILQILYLVNFLHCQDQPRCLGPVQSKQIFWPMAVALPYLGQSQDQPLYSIENDVKQVGQLMKQLIGEEEDQYFRQIISEMINPNKYERSTIKKCISALQEMLCL